MRTRAFLLVVHRWLGLGLGLFFAIASLTGSVLVFQPELERMFSHGVYPVTPGDVGVEIVAHTLATAFPGAEVRRFRWPGTPLPVYRVWLSVNGRERAVAIDPGSGRVIEAARSPLPIIAAVRRIHTSLGIGRPGNRLLTVATGAAAISFCTGIILWWPGIRRFWRGFLLRGRRTLYILNFDVHQVSGVLALLLFATITGVLLGFPPLGRGVAKLFGDGEAPWGEVRVEARAASAAQAPLAALARDAATAVPEGQPVIALFPENPGDPIDVRVKVGPISVQPVVVRVLADPADGHILQVRDPRRLSPARRLPEFQFEWLHVGGFGGMGFRILYSAACAVGGLLFLTGALMWWLKRTRYEDEERTRRDRRDGALAEVAADDQHGRADVVR